MNKKIYFVWLVCIFVSVGIALPLVGQSSRPAKKVDGNQSSMFSEPMVQDTEKSDSSPAGPGKEKKVEPKKEESLKDLVITDIVVPITKDEVSKEEEPGKEDQEKY
ncbi:MAG: hypothetical protein WCI77_04295 [Candidatus Omnitrophota bacterium]